MVDFLDLAKKRLRWLERAWLIIMTFGTMISLKTGLFGPSITESLFNQPKETLFFLCFGIFATPYLTNKVAPIWNIISPIQDRQTIWEAEFVVCLVTTLGLTVASSCFFFIEYQYAIKVVLLLALLCSPLLYITAKYRWKVHLLETPKMKGYVNPQTKLELDERKKRFKNNFFAFTFSGLVGSVIQLLMFSICLIIMDKIIVFSFFSTFIITDLMINMSIPPLIVITYNRYWAQMKFKPKSQYFIGASVFSITTIAVPKLISTFTVLLGKPSQALAIQSLDLILFVTLMTYIFGFLIGALVFDKLYTSRPKSLDFV